MSGQILDPERVADCRALLLGSDQLALAEADISSITLQAGGLFNYLLRVTTTKGVFYFKQYLDNVPNKIFSPPTIPSLERAQLAYSVQQLAAEADRTLGVSSVPAIIEFDTERRAFLMQAAPGKPLIELFSTGTIPSLFVRQLPKVLGALHQSTRNRFGTDSMYGNRRFRDFKLGLQYDDIANQLDEAEARTVIACKEAYQQAAECVTHGDINSRNILVSEDTLSVIDFEQSHLGSPSYDLAYILCEAYIALHCSGQADMVAATFSEFLGNYFNIASDIDRDDFQRNFLTHLAVQIIYRFWGPSRASWTFYAQESVNRALKKWSSPPDFVAQSANFSGWNPHPA